MKHSPFAFFRKHQRILMAVITLMALFAFVFLDTAGGSRSLSLLGSGSGTAVRMRGGNISEVELANLRNQREIANRFLELAIGATVEADEQSPMAMQEAQSRYINNRFGFGSDRGDNWRHDIVLGEIFRREGRHIGLTVTKQAVEQFIISVTSNKLTSDKFGKILRDMQIQPLTLFNCIAEEMLSQRAFMVMRPFLDPTPEQYWEYYKRLKVQQTVTLAQLPVSAFTSQVPDPTAGELRQYFEKHKLNYPNQSPDFASPGFRQPDKTQLQYLTVTYEELEKKVPEVTDEEIKAHYEKNKATLYRDLAAELEAEKPAETTDPDRPAAPAQPEEGKTEAGKDGEKSEEKPADKPAEKPATEEKPTAEKPTEEQTDDKPEDKKSEDKQSSLEQSTGAVQVAGVDPCQSVELQSTAGVTVALLQEEKPEAEKPAAEKGTKDKPAAEEKPAAEDKPAEEKPAGEQPAAEQPAKGPALPAPPSTLNLPGNASDALKKAFEKPQKFKPLDDDLKDKIRDDLLKERVLAKAREVIDQAANEMTEIGYNFNNVQAIGKTLYVDLNDNGELDADDASVEWSSTVDLNQPIPEDLQKKLNARKAEMSEKALQALGKKLGLKFGATGLIGPVELEAIPGLSKIEDLDGNDFEQGGRRNVFEIVFGSSSTFVPFKGTANDDEEFYAYWEVTESARHVPKFEDEGIKEQVLAAWKLEQAYELAVKRAEELAKLANDQPGKSLAEALGGQTVTGDKGASAVTAATTAPFSWMSISAQGMNPNPLSSSPPVVSTVNYIDKPGPEFFQAACEGIAIGSTGVAPDIVHENVYVIRVDSRTPQPGEEFERLRESFLKERLIGTTFEFMGRSIPMPTPYDQIKQSEESQLVYLWSQSLKQKYNVTWTNPEFAE